MDDILGVENTSYQNYLLLVNQAFTKFLLVVLRIHSSRDFLSFSLFLLITDSKENANFGKNCGLNLNGLS